MCAKCCRYNGGCGQHPPLIGAAPAPPPQQPPQLLQPQQAPPLQAPLPAQAAAVPQQQPPQAPAPAQQQPDMAAAPGPVSQLAAILQQLTSLLPALAAAAQAPPPPPAALPAPFAQPAGPILPAPLIPPAAPVQPAPLAPAVLMQAPPLIPPAAPLQQAGPFAQPAAPMQPQAAQHPAAPVAVNGLPPMPPGLWPPPPVAPASHLAAYPPPIGNVGPAQLLSQAQSAAAQVSPQHTHSLAATQLLCGNGVLQASGSGHVDVHLRHSGSLAADAYPCDPSAAGTRLSRMPIGILPVNPEKTGKPPRTAEEFHDVLTQWLRNEPELQQDGQRQAYEDYVSKTVLFAKDYGLAISLAYHAEAVRALLHQPFPLYDPYLHGSIFHAAYQSLIHGKPKLGAAAAASRSAFRRGRSGKATFVASDSAAAAGKKRKSSSSSSSDPQAECSVTGHTGHTNADCRWQKQLKGQQSKKKAKASSLSQRRCVWTIAQWRVRPASRGATRMRSSGRSKCGCRR